MNLPVNLKTKGWVFVTLEVQELRGINPPDVFSQNVKTLTWSAGLACPTGSSNGSPSGQLRPAGRVGEGQRLQHRLSLGPQPGLQEECWPGRGQGQGLRARAGVCLSVCECVFEVHAWSAVHELSSHVPQSVVKLMRGVLQCIMRQVRGILFHAKYSVFLWNQIFFLMMFMDKHDTKGTFRDTVAEQASSTLISFSKSYFCKNGKFAGASLTF